MENFAINIKTQEELETLIKIFPEYKKEIQEQFDRSGAEMCFRVECKPFPFLGEIQPFKNDGARIVNFEEGLKLEGIIIEEKFTNGE